MEQLFQISNLVILPFWFLMIALPTWKWTQRIIASPWICVPPALLYSFLVLPGVLGVFTQVANPQLSNIQALLSTPQGTNIAWLHMITFDLFVGRWIYLESKGRLPSLLISVVLFFTLMFGPLGFVMYLLLRVWKTKGQPNVTI